MTPQARKNGPQSAEQGGVPQGHPTATDAPERPVEGEGRPGPVDPHRWEALFQRERDDLAARLAAAEAERDEALARFDRYRLQFREITFDGLSLADWHTKHCAAQQVALAATAKVDRVMAMTYASDDGAEFEHNGHDAGFGEPECPGCWAEGIRAALADEEGR